ncbi:hypothetical protein diail_11297 [Diaporthe ilicicola]|nr:hypothetical protein diail_11297 [Diaporthe ilicicola]
MESNLRLQRQRVNVEFLDEQGQSFAGLYVLQQSSFTVAEALDMVETSFDFTFSTDERDHLWTICPHQGQLWNKGFSVNSVLTKGRYHVVRHLESCGGILFVGDDSKKEDINQRCFAVLRQAIAKPPRDYRPAIIPSSPIYELSQEGKWQETIRAEGQIPQGLRGAEEAMKSFHSLSSTSGRCCAISGLGRFAPENSKLAWPDPGLTLSQIIPPQHFEVYPVETSGIDGKDDELAEKWRMTWDPRENGIALLDHFHALWKARFVAIEPTNLTVRCFGPYDSISAYEGKKAYFDEVPNKEALRWHYKMCVYENITANQTPLPSSLVQGQEATCSSQPLLPTSPSKSTGLSPFTASDALPFATPSPSTLVTPHEGRPHKKARTDQDGSISLQLDGSKGPGDDLSRQFCSLKCILRLGDQLKVDPDCPNFSKHRRLGFGAADTAVNKVNMNAVGSRGLLRDEDVPKSQLGREGIISQYEIVSRGSSPVLKVVLPYGYTVVGKGVVLPDHLSLVAQEEKQKVSLSPLMEAEILLRLGSELAGECVPFCLGLVSLAKELRDPYYAGTITRVLLIASARVPLSKANVTQHVIQEETRRTVEDVRSRGVTLREPLAEADLCWNQDAKRVMIVKFAGARLEEVESTMSSV